MGSGMFCRAKEKQGGYVGGTLSMEMWRENRPGKPHRKRGNGENLRVSADMEPERADSQSCRQPEPTVFLLPRRTACIKPWG